MAHIQERALDKIDEICERYADENTPLMMILSDIKTNSDTYRLKFRSACLKKPVFRLQRYTVW